MSILVVRWSDTLGRAGVFHVMIRKHEWTAGLASRFIDNREAIQAAADRVVQSRYMKPKSNVLAPPPQRSSHIPIDVILKRSLGWIG